MARTTFGALLVFAAFAQAAMLPELLPIEIVPGPVLVLIFLWSARLSMREAAFWAFGAGILLDLLALDPLGANGLALLGAVLLGTASRRRFFQSALVVPIVLAMAASLLYGLMVLGLRSAVDGVALQPAGALRVLVPQALLNGLLVPVLYPIAGWLASRAAWK